MSTKTIVRSYQTRPEWLRERRHGIGASDAAALYGESPWQSPMSLWAEKRGLTAAIVLDAMLRGHAETQAHWVQMGLLTVKNMTVTK